MATQLDSLTLDRYWDALVSDAPRSDELLDDSGARLLDQLSTIDRPSPPAAFVASLEAHLTRTASQSNPLGFHSDATSSSLRPALRDVIPLRIHRRSRLRYLTALAALLAILLAGAAIIYATRGDDMPPSIPAAVPDQARDKPLGSGATVETLLDQTFDQSLFSSADIPSLTWVEYDIDEIAPNVDASNPLSTGERYPLGIAIPSSGTRAAPGLSIVVVLQGKMEVQIETYALHTWAGNPEPEFVNPHHAVILQSGDSILFASDSDGYIRNRGTDYLRLLTVGGAADPGIVPELSHTDQNGQGTISFGAGVSEDRVPPGPITVSIRKATIGPGENLPYEITADSFLLELTTAGQLMKAVKDPDGSVQTTGTLFPTTGSPLHYDMPGSYLLLNNKEVPATVYLLRIGPAPDG
jgi:hypothetical protein